MGYLTPELTPEERVQKLLGTTDQGLIQVLALCSVSTEMMAKTFFPERFYAEFSPLHKEIFVHLDGPDQYNVFASPRGIGKTSIVGMAYAGRNIIFQLCKFLVYVSTSFEVAQLQTDNLKMELATNRYIKEVFGPLKPQKVEGIEEQFSRRAWVSSGGTLVLPRGSGQQIRGLIYRNYRPDRFVIDDLEDAETIENDDVRIKRKIWFNADVMKAVSRTDHNYKFVYIDTLKHHDALLKHLLDDTSLWKGVCQEICGDDLKSKAPSFMSDERVLKEYEYHRAQGILDVFAREYRNKPIAGELAVFKPEYFKYFKESEVVGKATVNFIICDPAKTPNMQSADSAVIVVSADLEEHIYYIRRLVSGKFLPDELYRVIFDLAREFRVSAVGVEVTSLHTFITQPIKNLMSVERVRWELIELKAVRSKEERIRELAIFYRKGWIRHNEHDCHKLEGQLIQFPRSALWDCMDAEAYLPVMLDSGFLFFNPDNDEDDEDPETLEREYKLLSKHDDAPLEGWRVV